MSSTYTYIVPSAVVGANKLWIHLVNGAGSGKVIRLISIRPIADTDVALVGVVGVETITYLTNDTIATGGTSWNYRSATLDVAGGTVGPHDTNNSAIPSQITAKHLPSGVPTITSWIGVSYIMLEESATSMAYQFQGQVNLLPKWEEGNQHIRIREGEGILIRQGAVAGLGNLRYRLTFCLE